VTRTLGVSGPPVTRLGLGLAALGRPAYITLGHGRDIAGDADRESLERRTHALLDEALRLGIRYVDAARSYGLAEAFLAGWLDRLDVRRPTVGSKWGYTYVGEWRRDAEVHEVKDHSVAAYRRQLDETRRLLGDAVDVYQIHSVTPESPALDDSELLAELAELAAEGVVIGLSTSGPHQAGVIRRAIEVEVDGERLIGSIQATWNVLEPSAGPALAEAHDAGIGVIVKEALANGRLAGADAGWLTESFPDAAPDAVAIAAVLAQSWADVVLSGAVTADQLRSNVGALRLELDPAMLLRRREEPAAYWATRGALEWT
jgi:aryl-alcohol dehydrogenase-like predicted oxidoreductase